MKRLKLILVAAVVMVAMCMPSFSFAADTDGEDITGDTPSPELGYDDNYYNDYTIIQSATGKVYNGNCGTFTAVAIKTDGTMEAEKFTTDSANAGTYTFTFKEYGELTYTISKSPDNVLTVSPASKTYKYKKTTKKKAQYFTIAKKAKYSGKITYKSSSSKVTVSSKGKVTVKKGTKKGTYKVYVTLKSPNYTDKVKVITIKVK